MTTGHTAPKMIDPIAALINRNREYAGARPVALVAMDMDVTLRSGLAIVETKRTFRNDEKAAIEALLSLPVPVHAAFFGLTAKIDGRMLKGVAQARDEARETYEEAVSEGKTAVLHEELLRGVHSLSVGNLAPGAVIEVTTRWADTLRSAGASCGRLRIPITVGDVYGTSQLPETDELTHGKGLQNVSLRIRHDADAIRLAAGTLRDAGDGALAGEAPANAPIDIEAQGWKPGVLTGKAWDGRDVSLHMDEPEPDEAPVRLAVLVDHSGSMGSLCEGNYDAEQYVSKHAAVCDGLRTLAAQLRNTDRLSLWEFDNTCDPVGGGFATSPEKFASSLAYLTPPRGGTDIGDALEHVFLETDPCDVLLITDGKSHRLDVHRLAQEGRRVFVVLVGEDSLEANVGHLAALTGGDIHFSFGADVDSALRAVLQGVRTQHLTQHLTQGQEAPGGGELPEVCAIRGNVRLGAAWSGEPVSESMERDILSEGIAAYAASLSLTSLSETTARQLAIGEGLVTHLTSLVLVDEEGPVQEGLPVTRKVDLPTPRTAGGPVLYSKAPQLNYGLVVPKERKSMGIVSDKVMREPLPLTIMPPAPELTEASYDLAPPALDTTPDTTSKTAPDTPDENKNAPYYIQSYNLEIVTHWIDWKKEARALATGNFGGLEPAVVASIQALADHEYIQKTAVEWGIDPLRLAMALVAAWAAQRHEGYHMGADPSSARQAKRVQRSLLKGVDSEAFDAYFREFDPTLKCL